VDAKGPLATFVSAAAQVGVRPGWKITVVGAVGEEDDGRGARHIRAAHKPQYLVIGEPSQWNRVTLGYKGDAYFWYVVRRSVTHTATQLESACEAAVNFWNQVAAHCAEFNTGKTRSFDLLMPSLRSLASSSDVDLIRGEPAYRADKNNPLVRAFLAAIRRADGEPSFALKTGTSDMNTVAPIWACPTLAYGPGDSHLDHTAEEHISISEYLKSIQILAEVLTQLTR
jgi:LysW-gamma-L-lysine carboxypeptidase